MRIRGIILGAVLCVGIVLSFNSAEAQSIAAKAKTELSDEMRELMAQNMLLYQRSIGGWPKHVNDVKIDYSKQLSAAEQAAVKADVSRKDATIDNNATIKEIKFLSQQYKATKKKEYIDAVNRGIDYLLKAQYANGGWPQFYPDFSNYRHQITYNDNAMINVLNTLQDIVDRKSPYSVIDESYVSKAKGAVAKGVDCILKTQIKVDGKLTGWCAQYDEKTLQPAKARAFELISISGFETVGVVDFLMKQKNPSGEIKAAVAGAVDWLNRSKIVGFAYNDKKVDGSAKGFDRFLEPQEGSVLWARFYDIESNEPFFVGRDGIKKKSVAELDYERRTGYSWYGIWPKALLESKYPDWAAANSIALK